MYGYGVMEEVWCSWSHDWVSGVVFRSSWAFVAYLGQHDLNAYRLLNMGISCSLLHFSFQSQDFLILRKQMLTLNADKYVYIVFLIRVSFPCAGCLRAQFFDMGYRTSAWLCMCSQVQPAT